MHRLRHKTETQVGRLLRVLFLRLGALSANSSCARGRTGCCLRRRVAAMSNAPIQISRDWLGSVRTSLLAWWVPKATIVAGLFFPVSVRAVIWIIALAWIGTACVLNARRC